VPQAFADARDSVSSSGEILPGRLGAKLQTACRHSLVKIVRQWRLEAFPFLSARMAKTKLPCVQHLSRKILCSVRIDFVAEHGMTEMMKMHANLMSPSGV
jgi:hypothetical protein